VLEPLGHAASNRVILPLVSVFTEQGADRAILSDVVGNVLRVRYEVDAGRTDLAFLAVKRASDEWQFHGSL
jgi:hypothetical protein